MCFFLTTIFLFQPSIFWTERLNKLFTYILDRKQSTDQTCWLHIFWTENSPLTKQINPLTKQTIWLHILDKNIPPGDHTYFRHKTVHWINKMFTYILDRKQSIDQTQWLHIFRQKTVRWLNKLFTYILDRKQPLIKQIVCICCT